MTNFKPQVTIITEETRREASYSYGKINPYKTIQYPTYRKLLKDIKQHLINNIEGAITVIRSRKAEWGEWFETWRLGEGNKPYIVKQGWM